MSTQSYDPIQIYRDAQRRVAGLARDGDEHAPVPACDGWTVGDVVRHVTGLAADVVAGRVDGYAGPEWTERQIDERRDVDLGAVLDEWDALVDPLLTAVSDFESSAIPPLVPTFFGPVPREGLTGAIGGDLTTHEQDVRHALSAPGERESDAVAYNAARTMAMAARYADEGSPSIAVADIATGAHWTIGGDGGDEPDYALRATSFELLRAGTGRRTVAEILSMDWSPTPPPADLVPRLVTPAFTIRASSLGE